MSINGNKAKNSSKKLLEVFAALFLALVIGGIFFQISGYYHFQAYGLILIGAFCSRNTFLTTLSYATPLILSGLAFAVAKQANIMNLGGEGQIYVGAMTAAIVGTLFPELPNIIYVPFVLLCAFSAAGLYGGLAGFLDVKFGSNIVIVTIMLNYISQNFCGYLVASPLRADESTLQTALICDNAKIGRIFSDHQLSGVFFMAVGMAVIIALLIRYTKVGFHMRTVGYNRLAAETAGINYKKITMFSMFLSAGIAGLCGAGQIMGVHYRFIDNFSLGYGFEGIAVAALAANHPMAILISGILFGGLKAGAMSVNRVANIPMDYILIIQALVIVFIAAPKLISQINGGISGIFKKKRRVAS